MPELEVALVVSVEDAHAFPRVDDLVRRDALPDGPSAAEVGAVVGVDEVLEPLPQVRILLFGRVRPGGEPRHGEHAEGRALEGPQAAVALPSLDAEPAPHAAIGHSVVEALEQHEPNGERVPLVASVRLAALRAGSVAVARGRPRRG